MWDNVTLLIWLHDLDHTCHDVSDETDDIITGWQRWSVHNDYCITYYWQMKYKGKALLIIICFSLIVIVYRGKKIINILFMPFYLYINEKYYDHILTTN